MRGTRGLGSGARSHVAAHRRCRGSPGDLGRLAGVHVALGPRRAHDLPAAVASPHRRIKGNGGTRRAELRPRTSPAHLFGVQESGGARLLFTIAARAGLRPSPALLEGLHREGPHDRDRRPLRVAHDTPRPEGLRSSLRPSCPAALQGAAARRSGAAVQPQQRADGGQGWSDDGGRGDGSLAGRGSEHPPGRDPRGRDRCGWRLPKDDGRGELRDQAQLWRCDKPELQSARAELGPPVHRVAALCLPQRAPPSRHRAGGLQRPGG